MIEVSGLTKYFGEHKVLDNINLKIDYGQAIGLMGRSGCGKTTLARIMTRLIKPTNGTVYYRGEDIFKLKPKKLKIFRRKVQIIFQDPMMSLDPRMRIKDVLMEPFIVHRHIEPKDRMQAIGQLLKKVELNSSLIEKYPHQLSGGERQRVNIARALSVEPKLLICDEPVSSLDLPIQAKILKLLMKLRKEENLTLLFISHDINIIKIITDRIIYL